MAMALLIATGVAVCVTIQLLVPRYWFALFPLVLAGMQKRVNLVVGRG
jgi:hypothetical protein